MLKLMCKPGIAVWKLAICATYKIPTFSFCYGLFKNSLHWSRDWAHQLGREWQEKKLHTMYGMRRYLAVKKIIQST